MKHVLVLCVFLLAQSALADGADSSSAGYRFTMLKELKATPAKNQYHTSTCWSFSAISMLESELLRMGKTEMDLSEMFIVRNIYERKAEKFVRMHGNIAFAPGGAFNDVLDVMRDEGLLPDAAYPGLDYGEDLHAHGELDAVLRAYVDALVKAPNGTLSTAWKRGIHGILDAYLGTEPTSCTVDGRSMTPRDFTDKALGLNPDDYVLISSFSHHPWYRQFVLEVPDNWSYGLVYNLPLDEMMRTIRNAVENGYTVAWASDVSEKGFNFKKGIAVVPAKRWEDMSKGEADSVFLAPGPEMTVTQELRQKGFDNYSTQDDHGMHITGMAEDQNGTLYYFVKNSWGTKNNPYKGWFYASDAFVRYKTTSIMLHRNAIPEDLRAKLKL